MKTPEQWRALAQERQQAVDADPDNGSLQFELAEALFGSGDMAGAQEAYARSVDLGSEHTVQALVQLAGFAAGSGNLEECRARLNQALERNPDYGPAWVNLGFVLLQQGEVQQAVDALARGAELEPHPPVLTRLAVAYLAAGQPDLCAEVSRKALDMDPNFGPAWDTLAVAAYRQGDKAKAREYLAKVEETGFPPNPELSALLEQEDDT